VEFKNKLIMKNDNKLIAEFMGMEDHQEMGEYITPNYKTWEWLMPVVSKILTNENYIDMTQRENIMDSLPYGMIDDTYDAVVEFINEYNN